MINYMRMKIITFSSRYLISILLSCSIVLFLYDDNFNSPLFTPSSLYKTSFIEPVESIWDSLRAEFKLNHQEDSPQVQAEIRKLLADKETLYKILESSAPYIYFIHKETKQRSLPAEIVLIPAIESQFNPNDYSHKGATGLWQLMPATATQLGVKVKANYDGRRNVVFSTQAALAYLNNLKKTFQGNWYLAISAYNCGAGKVLTAIRRNGTRDVWHLTNLPPETRAYLPRLLAVAALINHPEKYDIHLPPIMDKPYFVELTFNKPVNLRQIARAHDIDLHCLHALNADYQQGVISDKAGTYSLLIPIKEKLTWLQKVRTLGWLKD